MELSRSKKVICHIRISKHVEDFFCFDCLYSFRTKNKLELHGKVFENKDFYDVVMPSEDILINTGNMIRNHLLFMQFLNP